ncbi:phospho-sugar mutase [Vitiosangium sp. GDMCC 1.1324]|uniref:phospho-sugar mutase n=1 Tax=Vitiosangium sp. (strain GDMCC 1.1324) TaxID=2138576 RepID=UPI000D3D9290|nr:phospho-sugar mutase [Vitiosangium sp. GDMCC 1.1324]PTL78482.1 phospho-sugar mutase [Vitiosangium sp. GDMCC 1.1324]
MDAAGLKQKAEAWLRADPDPVTVAELQDVLARGDVADLADRFAGDLEFGTAGLRGVLGAGPNRMNRAVVRRTTAGLARYLKATIPDVTTRGVVVGRDGRRMSSELAEDTACVLAAEGIPAHVFPSMVPTPLVAFATLHLNAAAGIMVTASHNPPEYNGYKVYWENGAQIIPPHDKGIASFISKVEPANEVELLSPVEAHARALWRDVPDSLGEAYLDAILKLRVHGRGSDSLSIVYTAMHGLGGAWMEQAMERAGFSNFHVVSEQHQPDGAFPTVRFPNPEEPGAMDLSIATAERVKADLVLANDPDADRLAVMVRDGAGKLRMLTGNEVGVLLGHYVLVQGPTRRAKPHVVTTIVSSTQLGDIATQLGAAYDEVLTGFKWIANRALEREKAEGTQFVFGYEEALGYVVGGVTRDKDGIGPGLVFADLAAWCESRGKTVLGYLEEIQRRFGLYVSGQRNFTFPGAEGAQVIARIMEGFRRSPPTRVGELPVKTVKDYKKGEKLPPSNVFGFELDGGGRVTARPSGTEPKIKYYFELKETLGSGEPVEAARARAEARLLKLIDAFIALARERGQPEVGA